ncbi:MAG: LPS export ABC transporter periplasmic protein LptC [Armatimonadota bacterium]
MKKYLGLTIAIIIVILGGTLGYLFSVRYTAPDEAQSPATSEAEPSSQGAAVIRESTIRHTEKGRMAWKVKLENLTLESGAGAVAAEEVREALIYDESGKPVMRLTAKQVSGNTRSRNLELSGDVRAVSAEGAVFDSQLVNWRQGDMKLVSPGPVTMTSKNTIVHAQSCEFFVDDNIVKSESKIHMTIGKSSFTGTKLTYDVKSENFQLTGVQGLFYPEELKEEIER